jgi:hypothetical protein
VTGGAVTVPLDEDPVIIEPSAIPRPVPDGKWIAGTAMKATKADRAGSAIDLTWDVLSCTPSTEYVILYGNGSETPIYNLAGSECGIGTTGSYLWLDSPAVPVGEAFLWWIIVGTDGIGVEGSWGLDSFGRERNGLAPSNRCGLTVKDISGTCP